MLDITYFLRLHPPNSCHSLCNLNSHSFSFALTRNASLPPSTPAPSSHPALAPPLPPLPPSLHFHPPLPLLPYIVLRHVCEIICCFRRRLLLEKVCIVDPEVCLHQFFVGVLMFYNSCSSILLFLSPPPPYLLLSRCYPHSRSPES